VYHFGKRTFDRVIHVLLVITRLPLMAAVADAG
jgi:hypothetical protein